MNASRNLMPKSNILGPKANIGSNLKSFGPTGSNTMAAGSSMLSTVGTFLTSWAGMLVIIGGVMVLIWIYYETIGYYIGIGWEKMKWSRDHNEKIKIDVPGSEISAELTPSGKDKDLEPSSESSSQSPITTISNELKELESDVASALGSGGKEVFNVARNLYKFEDAEPLCRAFGAELATYDQVKEAHKAGADWCNYGWSKGQMALFPTQKETYEKLQQGPASQRDSCGAPGVNGGYFPNADQRFGVNCYGSRPAKSALDERLQYEGQTDTAFDKEVNKFKSELDTIAVNPWARGQWSS